MAKDEKRVDIQTLMIDMDRYIGFMTSNRGTPPSSITLTKQQFRALKKKECLDDDDKYRGIPVVTAK